VAKVPTSSLYVTIKSVFNTWKQKETFYKRNIHKKLKHTARNILTDMVDVLVNPHPRVKVSSHLSKPKIEGIRRAMDGTSLV
jgi:hypothetical protein